MSKGNYFLGRENYILYSLPLFGRYYIRRVLERNGLNQAVIQIPVNISQKAILGILTVANPATKDQKLLNS